ncbi:MAG: hypothetical protein ACRCST_04130 [Turicibacter sp.]
MAIFLLVVGVMFIMIGTMSQRIRVSDKNNKRMSTKQFELEQSEYRKAIEDSSIEFRQQFELTQQQLENLYAHDFSEMICRLEIIECQLTTLTNQLSSQIEKSIEIQIEDLPKVQPEPEQFLASVDIDEFLQQRIDIYKELDHQGKTIEEIAKLLNVGKGEILLLKNLSNKLH